MFAQATEIIVTNCSSWPEAAVKIVALLVLGVVGVLLAWGMTR